MSRSVGQRQTFGPSSTSTMTPNGIELRPLLDIEDVATRLNISVRHVRRLVAERRIPYLKLGNLLRFDPQQINDWLAGLAACRVEPDTAAPTVRSVPGDRRRAGNQIRPKDTAEVQDRGA